MTEDIGQQGFLSNSGAGNDLPEIEGWREWERCRCRDRQIQRERCDTDS